MSPWRRITLAGTMMARAAPGLGGPARPQPEGPRVEIKAHGFGSAELTVRRCPARERIG